MALAQTTVTGKVVSQEDGEPVIGASVKIAGTKTGTVTDVDGNFTLPNASKHEEGFYRGRGMPLYACHVGVRHEGLRDCI